MSDFTIYPTAFGRGEKTVQSTHCAMQEVCHSNHNHSYISFNLMEALNVEKAINFGLGTIGRQTTAINLQ